MEKAFGAPPPWRWFSPPLASGPLSTAQSADRFVGQVVFAKTILERSGESDSHADFSKHGLPSNGSPRSVARSPSTRESLTDCSLGSRETWSWIVLLSSSFLDKSLDSTGTPRASYQISANTLSEEGKPCRLRQQNQEANQRPLLLRPSFSGSSGSPSSSVDWRYNGEARPVPHS